MRQEYKERSERLGKAKTEQPLPAGNNPRGRSPMELLKPRELNQTLQVQVPTGSDRVTIPDPSYTFSDPVVKKTLRQLVEVAGRLVANRNVTGSGVTAPYGTTDDIGSVKRSTEVIRKRGTRAATTTEPGKPQLGRSLRC